MRDRRAGAAKSVAVYRLLCVLMRYESVQTANYNERDLLSNVNPFEPARLPSMKRGTTRP